MCQFCDESCVNCIAPEPVAQPTPLDVLVRQYARHPYVGQTCVPMLIIDSEDETRADVIEHMDYHPRDNTVTVVCESYGTLFFECDRVKVSAIGDVHVNRVRVGDIADPAVS